MAELAAAGRLRGTHAKLTATGFPRRWQETDLASRARVRDDADLERARAGGSVDWQKQGCGSHRRNHAAPAPLTWNVVGRRAMSSGAAAIYFISPRAKPLKTVTLSALVQRPTMPGSGKVASSTSNSALSLKMTLKRVPANSTRKACH